MSDYAAQILEELELIDLPASGRPPKGRPSSERPAQTSTCSECNKVLSNKTLARRTSLCHSCYLNSGKNLTNLARAHELSSVNNLSNLAAGRDKLASNPDLHPRGNRVGVNTKRSSYLAGWQNSRKLSDEQIELIRTKLAQGVTGRSLAIEFSVTESLISQIKLNKKRFATME